MVKKNKPLSLNSISMNYKLFKTLRNSNQFCSCLTLILPFKSISDSSLTTTSNHLVTEDLRSPITKSGIEVVRILDPEHQEPFVSLSRIFTACSITTLEGILKFNLKKSDFDNDLNGIAPFKDIWVSLNLARKISTDLNRIEELSGLLEWNSRTAWSVEDKEVGGLIHNWKIPVEQILPEKYSTDSMLETSFPRIQLLPKGNQVRTLLPTTISNSTISDINKNITNGVKAQSWEELNSKLTEWIIHEYFNNYLALIEEDDSTSALNSNFTSIKKSNFNSSSRNDESDYGAAELMLSLGSIFTTSLSILDLSNLLPQDCIPKDELYGSSIIINPTSTQTESITNNSKPSNQNKSKEENFLKISKLDLISLATSSNPTSSFSKSKYNESEEMIQRNKSRIKSILGMCEFLSRILIREWERSLVEVEGGKLAASKQAQSILAGSKDEVTSQVDERMCALIEGLETRIKILESSQVPLLSSSPASRLANNSTTPNAKLESKLSIDYEQLKSELTNLQAQIDLLQQVVSAQLETDVATSSTNLPVITRRSMITARELNFVLGLIVVGFVWKEVRNWLL